MLYRNEIEAIATQIRASVPNVTGADLELIREVLSRYPPISQTDAWVDPTDYNAVYRQSAVA